MPSERTLPLNHKGASLEGLLTFPTNGRTKHSAVLVVHDARGRGPFYLDKARQLAGLGYVSLAVDMYGDGHYSESTEEAGTHFVKFHNDPTLARERMQAWHEMLSTQPEVDATRIAAIGYCFGGQCVLELARSGTEIKAVVSYHGLLTTHQPATPNRIRGIVAVYTGSKDPYVPHDHVLALQQEMKNAEANLHLTEFSDAYHSFTNPAPPPPGMEASMRYDPLCDRISWAGTLALLEQSLLS